MRKLLEALCRLVLRIFFRRVEVVGADELPGGGLLLAPNHPNALVDPLVVLCLSPRPASFLAKAPLFDTAIVKVFVRALDSLPVYREKDGFDTSRNRETLQAAARVLGGGGAVVVFPEGKSHDEPDLEPLKTGPARIALGARASGAAVHVVPCGIFYSDKATFRSDAVLVFGEAIEVPRVELDHDGEPPRDDARALTSALRSGLDAVLVQGESHELLHLAAVTARIVQGARRDLGETRSLPDLGADDEVGAVERERRLRRRLLEGYRARVGDEPALIADLVRRIERLEALCRQLGVDPAAPSRPERRVPALAAAAGLLALLVTTPVALAGVATQYPVYRLVGAVAQRLARGEENVVSTMKMLGGLLFYPASWLLAAIGVAVGVSALAGLATLAALPTLAFIGLRWVEGLDAFAGWTRTLALRLSRRDAVAELRAERQAIYHAVVSLSDRLEG